MNSTLDPEVDHDRIVGAIYDAALDARKWDAACKLISSGVGSDCTNLHAFDKQRRSLALCKLDDDYQELSLDFIRRYHRIDPRAALAMSLPAGPDNLMQCHEHFDDAFVERDPFYQEFLIPNNLRYVTGGKFHETARHMFVIGAQTSPASGPLSPAGVALLKRLMPHLARAMDIMERTTLLSAEQFAGHEVIKRLRIGVLLTDVSGQVVLRNGAAERYLARYPAIALAADRLWCSDTGAYDNLLKAIEDVLERDAPRRNVFLDSDDGQAPSGPRPYVCVQALRPQEVLGAFGMLPLAMLTLCHTGGIDREPIELENTFGLTPAEARVAVLVLAGKTPKGISQALDVGVTTVRSHMQALFAKTGSRRQVELALALSSLPPMS